MKAKAAIPILVVLSILASGLGAWPVGFILAVGALGIWVDAFVLDSEVNRQARRRSRPHRW